MVYYYIYRSNETKQYEIYQSRQMELGKYSSDGKEYYFAAFTRLIDASDYVKTESKKLHPF